MKKSILQKTIVSLLFFMVIQIGYFSLNTFAATSSISLYDDNFTWKNTINFTNPVNGHADSFTAGEQITRIYNKTLGTPAYCIEPGAPIQHSGTTYSSGNTSYWNALGRQKQRGINLTLYFGYPNNPVISKGAAGYVEWQITQIAVWEYVLGYRDPVTNVCNNRVLINNVSPRSGYGAALSQEYNYLDAVLSKHKIIPSFMSGLASTAPIITLKYNPSSGLYETTLTDTNALATLPDMPLSASNITFTKLSDKALKISTPYIISQTSPVTVQSSKQLSFGTSGSAPVVWSSSGHQTVCTSCGIPDPVTAYIRIQTESVGNIKIVKHSEDGVVAGRIFLISGNGVNKTVTTGTDGTITVSSLNAGTYTIQESNTPIQYNQPAAQSISVLPGQTTTVDFTNTLKKGRVKFVKSDKYQGGYITGAKYRIYKSNGTYTGVELSSNSGQWIYSPDLPYGSYYFQESQAPQYYALDSTKYSFTVSSNGQIISLSVSDPPLSDVYPTFIPPNASYRDNTEIIASYLIHNNSIADHTSATPLNVTFTAYYLNGSGAKVTIGTQQKTVVVPRFNENLVYFKVKIPAGAANIHFTCTVDTPSGVVESNKANNTDNQAKTATSLLDSQTPNTKFENKPDYFNKPDDSADIPTGNYATNVTPSATWQQWVYENNAFVKKTFGFTLATDQQLIPDVNSLSHYQEYGLWHMKSGYGVSLTAKSNIAAFNGAILPDSGAYVLPQNGNAYFPEFAYELAESKYRTLQLTAVNTLQFEQNPFSITKQGEKDGRRIHYTPLWYPDGNYTVKTYLFDCWTPAGMVSLQNTLQPVVIGGSMYDDWYINHTD